METNVGKDLWRVTVKTGADWLDGTFSASANYEKVSTMFCQKWWWAHKINHVFHSLGESRFRTGKHTVSYGGDKIGEVIIELLKGTSFVPRCRVEFQLESGRQWASYFECEINELTGQVRKHFRGRIGSDAMRQAAEVFELAAFSDNLEEVHCLLEYAGVVIGTALVSKDS